MARTCQTFEHIFRQALETAALKEGSGAASLDKLRNLFGEMMSGLDSDTDRRHFKSVIERAVEDAAALPQPELSAEDRDDVIAVLNTAHDGIPRPTGGG